MAQALPDYRPRSGKIEWHITYRCDLGCKACSRCSWMDPPHTPDMTLEDARECIRQADELGWRRMPGPGRGAEPPRVIIVGGEPTLHPDFLKFVELAQEWTGTYVQILSNGYSERARRLLKRAKANFRASITSDGFKTHARQDEKDGGQLWSLETYVSPAEAGLPITLCYCHCSQICGVGVDSSGYSPCPIGLMISEVLGVPGKTKRLADVWDAERNYEMTLAMCAHCGYEKQNRFGPTHKIKDFTNYAESCAMIRGARVSPIWAAAFRRWRVE